MSKRVVDLLERRRASTPVDVLAALRQVA